MGPVIVRVVLLTAGLALGEIGITALFAGDPIWIPELVLTIALLVTGSAGFIGPLLSVGRNVGTEVHRHP